MIFKSSKIGKKLYLLIIVILVGVFGCTYFLNNFFLSRYYIYKTKQNTDVIYNLANNENINEFKASIPELERQNNSTILMIPFNAGFLDDLNSFNQQILLELNKHKINITKLWVNEKDMNLVSEGDYVNKIFYQPKLQSDYFVKIFKKDNTIFVVGTSMANNQELIKIANEFNLGIIVISIILSVLLVWIFTRKTVKSIEDLKKQASNISDLKFSDIEIKTGDEIEELSNSINDMSQKLERAHNELNKKNDDLKILLSSISHEVKTPLALIKAYAMGMKDDLDDGTFTDIILEKVDETTDLITNLLMLSKAKREVLKFEKIELISLLKSTVKSHKKLLDNKGIELVDNLNSSLEVTIEADKSGMEMVFNNLISNAIKYSDGDYINLLVGKREGKNIIAISNRNDGITQSDLEEIWKPFFVVEKSRSKDLSGTGIGLSIVSGILENHDFDYNVELDDGEVKFTVMI